MRGLFSFCFVALCLLSTPGAARNHGLEPGDLKSLRNFFTDIDAGQMVRACSRATVFENPVAARLKDWVCLQHNARASSFDAYRNFMLSHAHWPRQHILQRKAEDAIPDQAPDGEILSWFDANPPATGRGALLYAGALQRAGRTLDLTEFVAKSWVEADFSRDETRAFHRQFRSLISSELEQARLERLLWDRQYSAAARQARLVPDDLRKLAEARIALGRRRPGVDAAIGRVPGHLRGDPGLVFERARWRWRSGLRDGALELLEQAGSDVPRPDLWWPMRHTAAREALSRGEIEKAYHFSSTHGMSDGVGFADGEWLAGWISLRFLKQPRRGYEHFARLYYGVTSPISRSRGAFWAGEAARVMGNEEWSQRWYGIAASFRTTFYGQLAGYRLGRQASLPINPHFPPGQEERAKFEDQDLVQAVKILGALDQRRYQDVFLSRLRLDAKSSNDYLLTAELAQSQNRAAMALSIAKTAQQNDITLLDFLYPSIEVAATGGPETALTLAVIRQESAFNAEAISRAGARGLMQLMPATAKQVARANNHKYDVNRLTSDPAYNVTLGQAYLADVMKRFNGSYILALAAYNAGPHRASRWIEEFGDPRDPGVNPIDWIEQIPFSETRNYVQRILESLSVYRLLTADGRSATATAPVSDNNPFVSWGHDAIPCCH